MKSTALDFYSKCQAKQKRQKKSNDDSAVEFKLPKRFAHGKILSFEQARIKRINKELIEAQQRRKRICEEAKTSYDALAKVIQSDWADYDNLDPVQDLINFNFRNRIYAGGFLIHDPANIQLVKGDRSCINNVQSPYIQCGINPDGDCSSCIDYEKRC